MLNDDVKKQMQQNPDLVCETTAACRYCGQIARVKILVNWGMEEAETVATELCDCTGAKDYTRRRRSRENAKKRIRQLFAADTIADSVHQDISSFLVKVVDAVADGIIKKATCNVGNGITAVIAITSKDTIKVQRVIRNDSAFEE